MASQEDMAPRPVLVFPSRTRKYVRLTPEQAYESIFHLLRENVKADSIESSKEQTPSIKARLGGAIGVAVNIGIFSEGDVSTLLFDFSYRNLLFTSFALIVAVIALCLAFWTPIPGVGSAIVLPLAYKANLSVRRFLDVVNEALPYIEREYARRALAEDRKRWKLEPKDTEELFKKLSEKHMRTWGNTNVLWYKINEYQRQGLIYNEAVRRIAEEEGIQ